MASNLRPEVSQRSWPVFPIWAEVAKTIFDTCFPPDAKGQRVTPRGWIELVDKADRLPMPGADKRRRPGDGVIDRYESEWLLTGARKALLSPEAQALTPLLDALVRATDQIVVETPAVDRHYLPFPKFTRTEALAVASITAADHQELAKKIIGARGPSSVGPDTLLLKDVEDAEAFVDPATKLLCRAIVRAYFGWHISGGPEVATMVPMFENPETGVKLSLKQVKRNGFSCDSLTGKGRGNRRVELAAMHIEVPPGCRVLLLGSYRIQHPAPQSVPMMKWITPDASGKANVDHWFANSGNVYATRRVWENSTFQETHLYPLDRQVSFVVVAPPADGVGLPRVLDRGAFVMPDHVKGEEGDISAKAPGDLRNARGIADDGTPHTHW